MQRLPLPALVFLASFSLLSILLYLFGGKPIIGDDIWGATNVLGNPFEVVVFTLRWDLHPPLYYSFIDFWAIFGKSDFWLRLSSLFLHALVTALASYYVLKKEGNLAASLTAFIVFASPLLLEYSTKIRMYAFISLISMGIFYLTEKYIASNDKKLIKWIFALGLLLSYSHAIGILFVFFHFLYAASGFYRDRSRLILWAIIHCVLAVMALPAVANSTLKSVSHAVEPSFNEMLSLFQSLFVSGPIALLVVPLVLLGLLFRDKTLRKIIICYLFLPVGSFAIISLTVKPLWLERNFSFALPMIGIAVGLAIARLKVPVTIKIAVPLVLFLLNLASWSLFDKANSEEKAFEDLLATFERQSGESDQKICIESVNILNTFWSLQRYLNRVEWANPMDIQPPINERWQQIANALPAFWVDLLELRPHPNFSESGNLIIASGEASRCAESDVRITYVVAEKEFPYKGSEVFYSNQVYSVYKK